MTSISKKKCGQFEAFINACACKPSSADRELMAKLTTVAREQVPGAQIRWAGSQMRGTGIHGSDLDMVLESGKPVTLAQRKSLRTALSASLGRPATIQSHVIRLPALEGSPKVDLAFANAAFGSRELPDSAEFSAAPHRQIAVRAFKVWTRGGDLPPMPGWAIEALVVHMDQGNRSPHGLELFVRTLEWLSTRATPEALESVLRPRAFPEWNEEWSRRLPGRLEALKNAATRLLHGFDSEAAWTTVDEIGSWLRR